MKILKYLALNFVVVVTTGIALIGFSTVKAFTLNPSSGTLTNGTTIQILAAPGDFSAQAVSVHIDVTSMTVTGFTPGADGSNSLSLGDCDASGSFTSTGVCFAYSRTSGTISAGDLLGSFTVSNVSSGATAVASSESEYLNSANETLAVTGQLGTFTVASSGGNNNNQGRLPNTALEVTSSAILLTFGGMCISFGVMMYVYLEGKKAIQK